MVNWFKNAQVSLEAPFVQKWRAQGVQLHVTENPQSLILNSIIVPKEGRKQGVGTQIMNELISYADQVGKRVELSPGVKDSYQGTTSRGRLVNFYKRFGFKENKGRNKDYSMSNSMFREPNELV